MIAHSPCFCVHHNVIIYTEPLTFNEAEMLYLISFFNTTVCNSCSIDTLQFDTSSCMFCVRFSDVKKHRRGAKHDWQTTKIRRWQSCAHSVGAHAVVESDAKGRRGTLQGRAGSETVRRDVRTGEQRAWLAENDGRLRGVS